MESNKRVGGHQTASHSFQIMTILLVALSAPRQVLQPMGYIHVLHFDSEVFLTENEFRGHTEHQAFCTVTKQQQSFSPSKFNYASYNVSRHSQPD